MDKMIERPTRPKHAVLFAIQFATAIVLFLLDIFSGPGIADGIGYSIVLVLCVRNPNRTYSLGWAGFTTLLVIAGGIVSPDSGVLHVGIINRALEISTIWVVWFLITTIAPTLSD